MWCWARPESEPGHGRGQASGPREVLPDLERPPGRACQPHPLPIQTLGPGSQRYSQTYAGVGREHVDVVLTQRVDDDGLAPVHQVGCKLENLRAEGLAAQCLGGWPTGLLSDPQPPAGGWAQQHTQRFLCSEQQPFDTGPCAVWDCHFLLGSRTVLAGPEGRSYTHRDIGDTQDQGISSAEQGAWLDTLAEAGPPPPPGLQQGDGFPRDNG